MIKIWKRSKISGFIYNYTKTKFLKLVKGNFYNVIFATNIIKFI